MIPSKNHNGFSFLEMMVALALLAIFGSSIFLVQTNLFDKLRRTHETIINTLALDQYVLQFQQKTLIALSEQQKAESITLQHDHHDPDYTVDIKFKPIAQESKLFKRCNGNVSWVQATVTQDKNPQLWSLLMYTKPDEKKEAAKDTKAQDAKATT
jgi:prepilin-type N-terminal cleavage/methylation domain-containing protein